METPIADFLRAYAKKPHARWHMPGHKGGGLMPPELELAAMWDITEIDGADDLYMPEGIIMRSQELAAQALGAQRTFYIVGGSTVGIHAMLLANLSSGDTILVDRSCHHSVYSALALCGAEPVYLYPEADENSGLAGVISVAQVSEAVKRAPNAKAIILTRPNVYGMCCDLRAISDIARKAGILTFVDEAHGAHLPFASCGYPESASRLGADAWVQSAHKTLPALTQSAMLSIRDKSREDEYLAALRLLQTSSPSYLLMASVECAIEILCEKGEYLLNEQKRWNEALRNDINAAHLGIRLLDMEDMLKIPGVAEFDSSRITTDVRGTGLNGYEAMRRLNKVGVFAEMADAGHVVFIGSCADGARERDMLECELKKLGELRGTHSQKRFVSHMPARAVMTPHEAMISGKRENVQLAESEGRVSGACVGAYPPGIPWICPGEVFTAEIIEALNTASEDGTGLFGLRSGRVSVRV